jgi:hypothetical protein
MMLNGEAPLPGPFTRGRPRVLILYEHTWLHVRTVAHYLESFYRYSAFDISYVSSLSRCQFDLGYFDAVVLHYSVRLCHPGHLSRSFEKALRHYHGPKVVFLQDEYEFTEATRSAISKLGISIVFSVVPPQSLAKVYPPERFPGVQFHSILTGYVPLDIERIEKGRPMRERPILIGYRGRNLGYWYGDLAQEKAEIGRRMKEICDRRGLKTDIAWEEHERIYGNDWFRFLANCKATLGTESGANVFDRDGSLTAKIRKEVLKNPAVTYPEIRDKYLDGREGEVVMNQISPKLFEAIACRTALVLFEGTYSGILQPGRHFFPLKKDFSNVEDMLRELADDNLLEDMTERTYQEIVHSGKYSYRAFVACFDETLRQALPQRPDLSTPWLPLPPCDALAGFVRSYQMNFGNHLLKRLWPFMPKPIRSLFGQIINRRRLTNAWVRSPRWIQFLLQPALRHVKAAFKRVQGQEADSRMLSLTPRLPGAVSTSAHAAPSKSAPAGIYPRPRRR